MWSVVNCKLNIILASFTTFLIMCSSIINKVNFPYILPHVEASSAIIVTSNNVYVGLRDDLDIRLLIRAI